MSKRQGRWKDKAYKVQSVPGEGKKENGGNETFERDKEVTTFFRTDKRIHKKQM